MKKTASVIPRLIVINLVVFIFWHFSRAEIVNFMTDNFLVSWDALTEGRVWVLLTSVFSHSMLWHLLLNMLVLANFGRILEIALGRWTFLNFYLAAGIFASVSHALVSFFLMGQADLPALGASGAISGLVMVFSMMFPREKILLFGLLPVPALIGAIAFVGLDLWGLSAQVNGGGLPIGHGAHLGGALSGVIFYLFFVRRRL